MEGSWESEGRGSQYLTDNYPNKQFYDYIILVNTLVNIAHPGLRSYLFLDSLPIQELQREKKLRICVYMSNVKNKP